MTKWKKLKDWWKKKVKKFKKEGVKTFVSGSKTVEVKEVDFETEPETTELVEALMEKLMETQFFKNELEELASKPITMLLPQGDKKRFFLFSPVLNIYRGVGAPVEANVIEESNGMETLCMINNVLYLVPDKYLKEVGYN
jgi:hypothetical protein